MSLHWFTSFKVRVCNIIFLLLYILPHAHHQKFSFCPKITQVSHLPISPFYSCPLLTLCSYYSVLYISICLFLFSSVCSFIYVCFLYSTYEWNHIVFVFFVCLISQLCLMDSQGPSMLLQGQDFIPFYGWVVFHCVCVCSSKFFEEFAYFFPQWLHQFTVSPTVYEGSFFFTSSPSVIPCFFDNSHSNRCEVILWFWFAITW